MLYKKIFVLLCLIFSTSLTMANDIERHQNVDGMSIYFGAIPSQLIKDHLDMSYKKSYEVLLKLAKEVALVNGTFITLFHNETLSNKGKWLRWKKLYIDIFKQISTFNT